MFFGYFSCSPARTHHVYTTELFTQILYRVVAPITDHLRDFAPNMEKCKVMQVLPM